MRYLLTFFILTCFHLSGEQSLDVAAMQPCPVLLCSFHDTNSKAVERTREGESSQFASPSKSSDQDDLSLYVEDDNEEDYSRKGKLVVDMLSTFSFVLPASQHQHYTNTLYNSRQISCFNSCKFIFQRALRI